MNKASFFLSFAVIVFIAVCVDSQQLSFQGNVKIYNDPTVSGILNGYMYFDGNNLKLRTDYTVGTQEIIQFTPKLKYLKCGSDCDTTTYTDPWPIFYKLSGDTAGSTITINGRSCTQYSRTTTTTGEVMKVWVASSGTGVICRAQLRESNGAGGTTIDFTNVAPILSSSVFDAYTGWNCPGQTCVQKFDMFLVFDESGSIKNAAFQTEKDFAISIAGSYTFGNTNGVGMGLVMFDDDARLITSLSYNQQSFINAVNGVVQGKGNTCIGCGIDLAQWYLDYYDRSEVADIIVVLTDGVNNVGDYQSSADAAKAKGTIIFVIGVGSDVSMPQLNYIASDPSYVFLADTFSTSDLDAVLQSLIALTCLPIPGNPCGSGCKGYCSCNQVCLCPDSCDDGNACTDDRCSTSSNGAGCYSTTKTCDDGNACTQNKCNTATGCYYTDPVVCTDTNVCTINTCDTVTGCKTTAVNCEDGNPCTLNTCVAPSTGCTNTTQACNKCLYGPTGVEGPVTCPTLVCASNVCDPATGTCVSTPKDCNDNNMCTTEVCSNDNCVYTPVVCDDDNECTIDSCSSSSGCVFTSFNASAVCDDLNVCTTDMCDPNVGCLNIYKPCIGDGDVCTTDQCNSVTGCEYVPRDCASEPDIAAKLGDCYEAKCDSNTTDGCYLQQVDGTQVDDCGYCKGSGNVCILGLDTQEAAAVGGGILAAIIIGSVALCAALGAFSSKVGYDLWMKHRNAMTGANSNPLYTANGMEGNNPFYRESRDSL